MGKINPPNALRDNWQGLAQFTPARIALGRAGVSLPTQASLEFQLAHALARDAVNITLDFSKLEQRIYALGYPCQTLHSQAGNLTQYLQRPDLGRLLSDTAQLNLPEPLLNQPDIALVVADGLSSTAIDHHAEAFLTLCLPELLSLGYRLSPVYLIKHGRVAIGDAVAEHCLARHCIVLIGERPGLSSPDSMGIYFTYQAKSGISTDANRNCISNIHNNGLSYGQALTKLLFLIEAAEKLQLSGVQLKDETSEDQSHALQDEEKFLLK